MFEKQLKEAFDPYYQAPIESWVKFEKHAEEVFYKKNEIIKASHSIGHYGYFLLKGAVGSFVWKKNNFACLDIFLENSFFADDYSLTSGNPSPLEIRSLEACHLLRLHRSNIEELKKSSIGKMLFLVGEQQDNAKKQHQQIELMTKTAEERYQEILENQPELLRRIPQKHIASLLGITSQSLSRIRRKFLQ